VVGQYNKEGFSLSGRGTPAAPAFFFSKAKNKHFSESPLHLVTRLNLSLKKGVAEVGAAWIKGS
jgi:hypothetical protein